MEIYIRRNVKSNFSIVTTGRVAIIIITVIIIIIIIFELRVVKNFMQKF